VTLGEGRRSRTAHNAGEIRSLKDMVFLEKVGAGLKAKTAKAVTRAL
jgi:hypothetical protein